MKTNNANNANDAKYAKNARLAKMLDKSRPALPMTGAAIGLVILVCVFSGKLRELLLRADMDLLAAAVALLPLCAVLVALGMGVRGKRGQPVQSARRDQNSPHDTRRPAFKSHPGARALMRRKAMLNATYDLNDQP